MLHTGDDRELESDLMNLARVTTSGFQNKVGVWK